MAKPWIDSLAIERVFTKHKTDKGTFGAGHCYHEAYDLFLAPFADRICSLLEIGIDRGRSLRAWRELLPNAHLTGIDKHEKKRKNAPDGCDVFVGDQGDKAFLRDTAKQAGPWDIIIDDGSHWEDHQQDTFDILWPYLTAGGVYVIEDTEQNVCTPASHRRGETFQWILEKIKRQLRPSNHHELCVYAFCSEGIFIRKPQELP